MASEDQWKNKTPSAMAREFDLSIEVVLLLILGVFMLLFGIFLFKIHTGALPYAPDSVYGLFLVIVSLQIITMGKTPFGDFRRSWTIVTIGICTAILGTFACYIPGLLAGLIRGLVGILLFAGGIALFLQLFTAEEKAKKWVRFPGILRQLVIACSLIYLMSVLLGLITLVPNIITDPQAAILLIIYGLSFFYLAWCIRKVARLYPPEEPIVPPASNMHPHEPRIKGFFQFFRDVSIPLSIAILIMYGVLITLLGLLLFPVSLGLLPFSPDGQLGLLLFIIAIQMLAVGNTPIGQYKRSGLLMVIGIVFAAMGIVSCIVPGLLTGTIRILLGLLNITGGAIMMTRLLLPLLHDIRHTPPEPVTVPQNTIKLLATQIVINSATIIFGVTVFIPGLVPSLVLAGILVIMGLLLLELAHLLHQMA